MMMQFHPLTTSEIQTQYHGYYIDNITVVWALEIFCLFIFPHLLINAFFQLNIQDFSNYFGFGVVNFSLLVSMVPTSDEKSLDEHSMLIS